MFKNVVSTQDLLSDSQRTNYSSDSALFSLSQRQQSQSQNEFSQVKTQDLFTQNQTSGSQSESSFPQTRKMSMYDKWMSKGAAFRKDQNKTATSSRPSFQPYYQHNAMNKANDSDDSRDLLQQVVNIVQDCNKEVKCTLTAVKEKLESQSELSGEKLNDAMKAFLEDIWKHEDRMLQAIQEGKQAKGKLHELEKQIAVKDAEIQQLRTRLEEKDKPDDLTQVAKAVRQEMLSPHLAVENKLMEILEVTREASEQHSEQLSQYQSQMSSHAREYKEWKTANHKLLKDMEKRLQKDITKLRKDLQSDEQEWRLSVQDQLSEANSVHTQDMERLIERAVAECASNFSEQGINSTVATSAIIAGVKKDLQAALQKQAKSTERNLKDLWHQQVYKQQQQLHTLRQTLLDDMNAGIQAATDQFHERNKDDWVTPLTVPAFEEKIEEYHSDLKKQLEEMHRNHVAEVKRLQKDTKPPESAPSSGDARKSFSSSLSMPAQSHASAPSCLPRATGYQLQRRTEIVKIPPLSEQDRCNLFSKVRPSPVVAVLPQQHSVNSSTEMAKSKAQVDSDAEVTFRQQSSESAEPHVHVKQSKKRKKTGGKRKRLVRKKGKGAETKRTKPSLRQGQLQKTTARQLTVYDFADDQTPDQNIPHLSIFQTLRNEAERKQLCSPSASTESCLSSPAVSITVDTELVMVRRSRWQACSNPKQIKCGDVSNSLDMLSSPFMTGAMPKGSQQFEVEDDTHRSRTRSAAKRML